MIPKGSNEIVNYQCDILKSEFTREVENMLKNHDTSFIADAVRAADAINSVRLKGEDIPLDIEIGDIELGASAGLGAIEGNAKLGKIAARTDIGKIANLVGDIGIGTAAGVEQTLNTLLKDKKVKADEFVANLDDVTYYSLMLSFAKEMNVEVTDPLKEEDVLRKLDDVGRKQYQMLKDKYLNGNVEVNESSKEVEDIKKNLYEEKLKELGIKKIIKKGFNSSSIVNAGIGYTRFSIPTYYVHDEQNEFSDEKKRYSVEDNENVKIVVSSIVDENAGNNINDYRKALSNGKISHNIESIIQNEFRDNTAEVFDYENVEINSQTWNKFKVLSNDYYYEVVEFLDVNTEQTSEKVNDKYVFIILREPISDGLEYNEDFSKIIGSIKKIETVKLGKDLEDIKKSGFIDAKEYLENRGFYNFDIKPLQESGGIPLVGLFAKKNNDIETITIDNNSKLKNDDSVRQDAKIVIEYYNNAKYEEDKERNKKIAEYNEEQKRRKEELEQEQQIQREEEEKEKRLNSKKTLTLDEIDKVILVTEYSDDAVIDEIDTIKFGKYPQDSRDKDDKQDIEWIVLDRKDGQALLLSKYILDCKKYDDLEKFEQLSKRYDEMANEAEELVEVVLEKNPELSEYTFDEFLGFLEQQEYESDEDCKKILSLNNEYKQIEDEINQISIVWSNCSLRKWLNEEFINIAFSDSEKESIVESTIKNFDNFEFKTKAGEDTKDKIFCLSIDEVEKFFDANIGNDNPNSKLATKGTKYAKTVDNDGGNLYVSESGNSSYWLRTPGLDGKRVIPVFSGGTIFNEGDNVDSLFKGVRPAMWVSY